VAVGDEWPTVIAGLKAEIAKMKVGPGTDNGNDMGPLVKQHFEKEGLWTAAWPRRHAGGRWPRPEGGAMRTATSWAPACSTSSPA
jgi:acyl-CoA reductase-like NAD-dependent aldehyde dehydrogenase